MHAQNLGIKFRNKFRMHPILRSGSYFVLKIPTFRHSANKQAYKYLCCEHTPPSSTTEHLHVLGWIPGPAPVMFCSLQSETALLVWHHWCPAAQPPSAMSWWSLQE